VTALLDFYRRARVVARQATGSEPVVPVTMAVDLEFHGNDYCGWSIRRGALNAHSVVVDVGLGEDITFSQSLIDKFGLTVHGFDPTPRAIDYIKRTSPRNFVLHELGVGARSGKAKFFLPINEQHVSGSLIPEAHLGKRELQVELLSIGDLFRRLHCERIDLFKLDIEGAEFDLIASPEFAEYAPRIDMLCVEFHHRWPSFGRQATDAAVATLRGLGFGCAWRATSTNEEFLFIRG
jgi:FkbM family methyltransferase